MEELDVLRVENDHLRLLAQQDSLTGLLNRGAVEERIDALLRQSGRGVLLMLDVDEFKYINDSYGHLTGDRTLQELGRVLERCFFRQDVIGRMGGDEFVVFLPGEYTREMVENKVGSLSSRIAQAGQALGISSGLRVTVGAEFAAEGDSFQALYDRADAAMRVGKGSWRKALCFYEPRLKAGAPARERERKKPLSAADMKYITRQLREGGVADGAFCQDYDAFLSIYRFLERGLSRTGLKVHLVLMTLTDAYGVFVPLEERAFLMEKLQESVRTSLRQSDIYTQYSSCQFLAMAVGAAKENMDLIAERIRGQFRAQVPDREDIVLTFGFYPLRSALRGRKSAPQPVQAGGGSPREGGARHGMDL